MFESVDGIHLILGRVQHAEPLDGIEAEFVLMRGVKLQRRLPWIDYTFYLLKYFLYS
jgi:hypothetical protein